MQPTNPGACAGTDDGRSSGESGGSGASESEDASGMDTDTGRDAPAGPSGRDAAMGAGTSDSGSESDVDSDLEGLPLASARAASADGARAGKKGGKGRQGKGEVITQEGAEASKLGLAFERVLGKRGHRGVLEVRRRTAPHAGCCV